jgi:hypothetical protein
LKQLKPAGYCGHVFTEGEISYKCVSLLQPPTPPHTHTHILHNEPTSQPPHPQLHIPLDDG